MRLFFAAAAVFASALTLTAGELVDSKGRFGTREWTFGPGKGENASIVLPANAGVIRVKTRMRTDGLVGGKEDWMNGRLAMSFHDAAGKQVGGWPNVFGFSGDTPWTDCERDYVVPAGAVKLNISERHFGTAGKVTFAPVSVTLVRNRPLRPENAPVPAGVAGDPESLDGAQRLETGTRTRYSLNGLWRARPAFATEDATCVPGDEDGWGWGKIPGVWSRKWSNWSGQDFILSDWWTFGGTGGAIDVEAQDVWWYRRAFVVPREAVGRRAVLTFTMVSTRAIAFVDGRKVGEITFPGGEIDVTEALKPGSRQTLALLVSGLPLGADALHFNAADRVDKRKDVVRLRGITGDLWLDLGPKDGRIAEVWTETSVARGEITFCARFEGKEIPHCLKAFVDGCGEKKTFEGAVTAGKPGEFRFTAAWKDAKLWDTHTPGNLYTCRLALVRRDGTAIDEALPFRFGFRDLKLDGRNALLNGKPIHLRSLTFPAMTGGATLANRESAASAVRRMQSLGFNSVVAENYDFRPGAVSHIDSVLEACDETGLLYAFTLPHLKDFGDVKFLADPENERRYRELTAWAISRVRNHPCVVAYAIDHNGHGYVGDMNPTRMDGTYDAAPEGRLPDHNWYLKRRKAGTRLKEVIEELDPTRSVYHHASGTYGDYHTVNIYLDWAPIQERSDWLEDWSMRGVKPMFLDEWGCPHIANWSSYRGPLFIWRYPAYHSLWAQEYAAAFRGDAAYEGNDIVRRALDDEERRWATGRPFSYGAMLYSGCPLSEWETNYHEILGRYLDDNWRSLRAWGVTAMLPWDGARMFRRVAKGTDRPNPDAYRDLKRSGIVPDRFLVSDNYFLDRGAPAEFEATAYGKSFQRWNGSDCAFIGGDPVFTEKRHVFRPGETVRKRFVILNDRRVDQTVAWSCALGESKLSGSVSVPAGGRVDVPVSFVAPRQPGDGEIRAEFRFEGDVRQTDVFAVTTLAAGKVPQVPDLLLYDPKGLTAAEFRRLGIGFVPLDDLSSRTVTNGQAIVIGRQALTPEVYGKIVRRPIRQAKGEWTGRVLVFEQDESVLNALGFRTQAYGLRNAFPRYRDACFRSLAETMLRDWAGEATLLTPHFEDVDEVEHAYARRTWAGYANTRVWRCKCRGNVASVLLEKPATGDWRALCDGAFDLEYAPLLTMVNGRGSVTFCQLDVTARTVPEPAAEEIVKELVASLAAPQPWAKSGKTLGMKAFFWTRNAEAAFNHDPAAPSKGPFVVSRGAKKPEGLDGLVAAGAKVLCCGFTAEEVNAWSPVKLPVADVKGAHYTRIETVPPELNGASNADWAWHGAMDFAAFTDNVPDGNNAFRVVRHGKGAYVFWQVPPWMIDCEERPYLRHTRRHANALFARLLFNLGFRSETDAPHYLDAPVAEDDPYRYYRW